MHRLNNVVRTRLPALLTLVLFFAGVTPAQSKRVALVIGNSAYQHTRILPNARSDAEKLATTLRAIGFSVTQLTDLGYRPMREAIRAFGQAALDAEMAVLYYAGHGLEVAGENWLAPTTASLRHERDLEYEAISLSSILSAVRAARRLRLVILDACRNNPLAERIETSFGATRSVMRGLARIEPPGDILVAYSAKHGTLAEDGPAGESGPFAAALVENLRTPGLDIRILLGRVRDEVLRTTDGRQEPFTYGSLGGQHVYLVEAVVSPEHPRQAPSDDDLAWMRAKAANRLEAVAAYLSSFPKGEHSIEAAALAGRLKALSSRWAVLQRSIDRRSLVEFIDDAEGSEFQAYARQRLGEVDANEARAWLVAEEAKLLRSYRGFLSEWPRGQHAHEAEERVRDLEMISALWDRLKHSDDDSELAAFVQRHGWSEFGAAAASRLIALRREQNSGPNEHLKVLTADELAREVDGATLVLNSSGGRIRFDRKKVSAVRQRLGSDFLRKQFRREFAGEGAYDAEVRVEGKLLKLDGLGAIVRSDVDGTGSLFLLQMYGSEKTASDIDRRDRRFSTLQIIRDHFGLVCIMTSWEFLAAASKPEKVAERCKASR